MSVSGSNYSFVAIPSQRNTTLLGNFTVLSGGSASIIMFNEASFTKWSMNQGAEVLFFTQPLRNGTFSFQSQQTGTYYVVVNNADTQRMTLVLSIRLSENTRMPIILPSLGGPGLLVLGSITTGLGVWHENRLAKSRRSQRLLQVAMTLGVDKEGKTDQELKDEIEVRLKRGS